MPLAWHIGTTVPELAALVAVVFLIGLAVGAVGVLAYQTRDNR
jgi:hypothetical protein